jgi:GNAT superfamily N-acetyltransferase
MALEMQHDVSAFDCGIAALTIFLQTIARQHQKKSISRTYVLVDDAQPSRIIGYYTLAIRGLTPTVALPAAMAKRLPREVLGMTLARLAVSTSEQGKGHGETLLINAMTRVRAVAAEVGGYAIFVDAKDAGGAVFYQKYGFMPFESDPLILALPIASIPSCANQV